MDTEDTIKTRVLDAADALFYAHGVQAVGMDRIREASGVSLKRLYRHFPSKGALVEAYLRRRDRRSRAALEEYVATRSTPEDQILAVFDWLYTWFAQPDFRGCAFNNAFGELGADSAAVAAAVYDHKAAVRQYLLGLVQATCAADPDSMAGQLVVLLDGATSVAAVAGTPEPARQARAAAAALLAARDARPVITSSVSPSRPVVGGDQSSV